jgi:hypothetical protein
VLAGSPNCGLRIAATVAGFAVFLAARQRVAVGIAASIAVLVGGLLLVPLVPA